MTKSLRLAIGDKITLCDGKGWDYQGIIESLGEQVVIQIISKEETKSEPVASITLFQALPKGDKMEYIIQKSVELGVHEIVPVLTSRCISRPDPKSMKKKVERYKKIAWEAAKQSGRGMIPKVSQLLTLEQAVERLSKKKHRFLRKRR